MNEKFSFKESCELTNIIAKLLIKILKEKNLNIQKISEEAGYCGTETAAFSIYIKEAGFKLGDFGSVNKSTIEKILIFLAEEERLEKRNKIKATKGIYEILFPSLSSKEWEIVNLNDWSKKFYFDSNSPEKQIVWINELHKNLNIDFSYGGYLEYRNFMLQNSYHKTVDKDHFWHLGIDYNVPVNTELHIPFNAELVHSEMDSDYDGGWGGKLIFKYKDFYFIFGHLDKIVNEKGNILKVKK